MQEGKINGCTFQEWLCEIDAILAIRICMSTADGADWPSYDTWESGSTPQKALETWLEWQDFPDMLGELLMD